MNKGEQNNIQKNLTSKNFESLNHGIDSVDRIVID